MQTTIVDLRYRMKDVLQALTRRERVKILYHGRVKGEIIPVGEKSDVSIKDSPFFGMCRDEELSVEETMTKLRGGRYRAI
ncbi:MAG: type II toxin-antitoxin system Phd/YefM family antitoxin [Candidatus Omnitrophica bacterium]|nr:type II toxin-antitoxin system Phd/YefM family antitoxin [Candidatus Omnitrophota bacterium]